MQRLLQLLRSLREYFVFSFLVLLSLSFLAMNDNSQMREIRAYTIGFLGIVQSSLAIIPNVFELQRENRILRQIDVDLADEVSRLREARLENVRLRAMLGLKQSSKYPLVAADVVAKSTHLLRNTITINVGTADGVKPDMPIICESGLVGKLIATSAHYSIGQLLQNKDFRASAKVERSRVDGIIAWEGGENLLLKNVPQKQDVVEGDVIMTSEYSNLFPPRIKIGKVVGVEEKSALLFKEILVAPSVDITRLEQVFVITQMPDTSRTQLEQQKTPER